jgi:hypothetical protein
MKTFTCVKCKHLDTKPQDWINVYGKICLYCQDEKTPFGVTSIETQARYAEMDRMALADRGDL